MAMKLYGYLVSSKNRIKIMKTLSIDNLMKSKEISKKTGLSWQTASAELNNLLKLKVVNKVGTGYVLTEKGFFLITRISSLPSFDKWAFESFVHDHQIHRIPPMILKDFGIWKNVDFMAMHATDFLAKEKDAIMSCNIQYRAINPNVTKIDLSLIEDKLGKIPIKFIYSKQALEDTESRAYMDEQIENGISIKLIDADQMYMIGRLLDLKEANVSFRNRSGEFDFSNYIVGNDEEFIFWCRRNFHYLWELGTPYEK